MNTIRGIEKNDILEAVSVGLTGTISADSFKPTTVDDKLIKRFVERLRKVLGELPPDVSVQELIEALDE